MHQDCLPAARPLIFAHLPDFDQRGSGARPKQACRKDPLHTIHWTARRIKGLPREGHGAKVWTDEAKLVLGMALFRFLAGSIEVVAALFMLKFRRVDTAFQINALLGLIGPLMFVLVSSIGLIGLAGRISYPKLAMVAAGVLLILLAARK